ncbi:MAG: tRNA (N(6)-L-threonylcarbamoyladenosine(37)-C(2))-methylthiotransferase MtaB [Rhodospirillaceae bacterium]|jgi:threonylcarbamoyladenosine tRNA methylthiotransferase MtaB|nr:tRNA (N(6)-L-threonylcarbamoyladenosine(37)-C(2))-methylthiotransferase MtaB [Rhodospirillaceae bacterium]MBT3494357.1 tRNA (N(6)-L-threonylcarbamoyladenosine(37)-C(2))-methylthiotransferase MtaB [Rhodospirillaceae bacterium]MBT3780379.1 tRNA (N(6)-L-threonylcarbamoyladenosine(37)-C(2))-methylthiotransferase MtaB [Rhodospirillaceae bacterium]MBT3979102.1 tRNA (N(6)-L-threonylcarbamoyladenosine(37)-C(2))-methylthiotransferase MtaB [Rhodospirillaceae bacterium]MBT4171046.1 tRNA (N(6)-L-threony
MSGSQDRLQGNKIINFGCRLNAYEAEVMRDQAHDAGLQDAVIINTCAVTSEAVRQARQAIRKARRQQPDATIVVTGCAAQLEPAAFAAMDEVDRVLGNREKLRGANFVAPLDGKILVDDIMSVQQLAGHLVPGFDGRSRAFVQVQQGCDHRCTFCIIPFARGPSRSVPMGAIVQQIKTLVANGYAEVVLTGVDITAYGSDLPGRPSLGQLLRRLLRAVPELPRLRLSSLDAVEIDAELERLLLGEERLMPHLHLSLQAGDDLVLKRMARRHSRAQAVELCQRLRAGRPDMVFGADLIAGFPTETEAQFQNSLALIDDCGLTYLHVFPYSERPGTPAARMPQVPGHERRRRAALLREKGAAALSGFLAGQVGNSSRVLLERPGQGRSEQFALIQLEQTATLPENGIVTVDIIEAAENHLIGRLAA